MHPSMFLLAAAVFAVPTRTITSLTARRPPIAKHGRVFDAGPRWVRRSAGRGPLL